MFRNAVDLSEGTDELADLDARPINRVELLIVDDQELIRESLRRIFQAEGCKVSVAEGGEAALEILKRLPVELILLDLNMPDLDGHQVLQYIADHQLETQVIVVSGDANFEEARRSLRFNFVHDFIKKPYDVKGLKNIVSKAKKMIRLEEENQRMLKRLHRSEQMHRFLVENSPDIFFLVNQYGHFTFLNKAIEGVLGYKLTDVIGKHYTKLIYQEDWSKAEGVFKSTPVEHNQVTAELRLQCQNKDEYRYVEVTAMRINPHAIDAFNQRQRDFKVLPKIFGVIRNIHERKRVENDLCKLH
ncbi:MAG: response regulator, partial [Gammaproteobacteria bacterium]